jgi:hypothetical protein
MPILLRTIAGCRVPLKLKSASAIVSLVAQCS